MSSRSAYTLLVVLLLLVAAGTTGCIFSREIARTRNLIEDEIPGSEFDRQIVLSIGPRTLRAAEWITTLAPDEDVDGVTRYLEDVEQIKVGVYKTRELPPDESFGVPQLSKMIERGWEVAVRVRDDQDRVWLMYRSHRGRVRALFIIVLNDENLVIARLEGYLDRLVERAMDDYRPFSRLAHR